MNVYISNTLSSIDNKLKDMGVVSLMTYSDERTQEILKIMIPLRMGAAG